MKVLFYGTPFCHLCDEAEALLRSLPVMVEYIDIAEDDAALERYETRIPVVRRVDTDAELGWPFDRQALADFLAGTDAA